MSHSEGRRPKRETPVFPVVTVRFQGLAGVFGVFLLTNGSNQKTLFRRLSKASISLLQQWKPSNLYLKALVLYIDLLVLWNWGFVLIQWWDKNSWFLLFYLFFLICLKQIHTGGCSQINESPFDHTSQALTWVVFLIHTGQLRVFIISTKLSRPRWFGRAVSTNL